MKVGSIVVCISEPNYISEGAKKYNTRPVINNIYTVNYIDYMGKELFIGLEELDSNLVVSAKCFREIEFPDDLMEEINEVLKEPVYA